MENQETETSRSRQYHLKFHAPRADDIDAYIEYKRVVGDDDGGQMFSRDDYKLYKEKVLPMRTKNRLYVSWVSKSGMDCKLIGPETPCFCMHRFRQHQTDFSVLPTSRPINIPCKVAQCKCTSYHYVPMNGSQTIRCTCKHVVEDHQVTPPYLCKKFPSTCMKCKGFHSCFTCACGEPTHSHQTLVETTSEREERGHPTGDHSIYQAMGGITGFSSLAEGYIRLDPSGRGAPNKELLGQPITANDTPILRNEVHALKQHFMSKDLNNENPVFVDQAERISTLRRYGETEMEYYERRHQEKEKSTKSGKRFIKCKKEPKSSESNK